MSESSFTNHLLHLEVEKIFGSAEQLVDYPPSVNNDSHHPDHVNLYCT